eukprot:COSAG01_NODE_5412_length_4279_cov_5.089474_4_plen_66_part_01
MSIVATLSLASIGARRTIAIREGYCIYSAPQRFSVVLFGVFISHAFVENNTVRRLLLIVVSVGCGP